MSKKISVLLVCGSGASSGFMAGNMRAAAAQKGLDIKILAKAESEIENYLDEIDCLMIAPHMNYIMDEIEEYIEGTDIVPIQMRKDYYQMLDGKAAINHLCEVMKIE